MAHQQRLRYGAFSLVLVTALAGLGTLAASAGCGGSSSEADLLGIGAQCTSTDQCDDTTDQVCLLQFKGGYCGLQGCIHDLDCPEDSACITHDDSVNYCFRICTDKPQCNANRDLENESNCSSSATFVDGAMGRKACVPPSGS
jgi:hypothetical protein